VKSLVNSARNIEYGDAEDNFKTISDVLNLLGYRREGGKPIEPKDVSVIMTAVKLTRCKNSLSNLDTFADIAGYAACAGGIINRERENDNKP